MVRSARVAWTALVLNLGVIVWGGFVRASGSGAGCGAHWPLCNGEVLPHSPRVETLIELTHRATSGLALLAVAWLVVEAFWRRPRAAALRGAAVASAVFIVGEAAIGAGLVLFRLVADNDSMARALFMGAHLVNTFLLLGALGLAVHFAMGGRSLELRARPRLTTILLIALGAVIVAGASGAVAALGDTLYPSQTLAAAFSQDLSPTAHVLIRLRIFHPAIAITAGVLAVIAARLGGRFHPAAVDPRAVMAVELLVAAQFAAGALNVVLLAPTWLQLVHLTLADGVWLALVFYGARLLGADAAVAPAAASAAVRLKPRERAQA
jgi:heme A synthase